MSMVKVNNGRLESLAFEVGQSHPFEWVLTIVGEERQLYILLYHVIVISDVGSQR